ncbi:AAA domain-containing protein [Colletotrichum navitas]|uniref:AAA domain-containing protein n=1 Tax=Colletotrichum navitas TaxID=681940 RepID=A0AAD8Q188_9PEZI|nr:AAA domain-containing protein [Colletotrichum navitas]KAK1593619.1 AAA domain-containing protein [Colletotrichum navitas]
MPSRVNYSDMMRGAPGTKKWPESTVAFAHELSKLLGPNAPKRTSRLVVQFPRTRATRSGTSFENRTHVEWVLHQVKGFLKNDRLTDLSTTNPARILIVPLYKAQVNLYRQVLADERSKGCISDEDLQRLDVRTLDSSQGEERDLVIVDYVQTDQAGFCTDPNRNCLATTRAIQAEIIIMNEGMLADFRAQKSKLAQIIAHASEFNYKLEVLSCTNCNSPTHTDDDCNDQLSCSYCKQPGHARVTCPKIKCSNCRELGHLTSNCPKAKLCQQCGAKDSVMHKKACLGRRICSNCWKCHTGDACTKCFHCRGENHRANECRLNPEATRVKNKQL